MVPTSDSSLATNLRRGVRAMISAERRSILAESIAPWMSIVLRAAFNDLGEPAADFFTGLERQLGRYYRHHARQILLLRERFTSEDIDKALRHAHAFGALDHHAVARILQARAAPAPSPST